MKTIIKKIEAAGIPVYEYKEGKKLCGYELNTYTEGGVNQVIFVDFRHTDKKPTSASDFKELFVERVKDIDIDEEIETNRQNQAYKQAFTLTKSLKDFTDWKAKMLALAE